MMQVVGLFFKHKGHNPARDIQIAERNERDKVYEGKFLIPVLIFALFFSACAGQTPAIIPSPVFVPYTPTELPSPIPTIIPNEKQIDKNEKHISNAVPQLLREQVDTLDIGLALDVSTSELRPNETQIQWTYVLVAPFPTIRDDVTFEELRAVWSGSASHTLLMDESTLAAFTALWGAPVSGSVRSVDAGQFLDTAWTESAWAIIPFESSSPRWKVLTIDGQSPIRKNFDITAYPLIVTFTLQTLTNIQPPSFSLHPSNYDLSKLTTVVITGTTALVRATAFKMEQKGITYPGEEVRDIMRQADIAHVSNEVSFFIDCPPPNPGSARLVFCSDPKNIGLLTVIRVHVVELTCNHISDYSRYSMDGTISIYISDNLAYYGGGSNLQDSLRPALFEVHGNKIAFLGCNVPDVGTSDIAADDHRGSAPCDFDYFTAKVAELKAQGYLVIFTFQWNEDYVSQPESNMVGDFRKMVDAGALIVSGSQAHFPKTMEFYNDAFIHYGLGNLFFDQMGNFDWMPEGIRREFLDRYVIYAGKLISVELIATLLEDFARPRIMTSDERSAFLQEYFTDSGWTPITDLSAPTGTSVP